MSSGLGGTLDNLYYNALDLFEFSAYQYMADKWFGVDPSVYGGTSNEGGTNTPNEITTQQNREPKTIDWKTVAIVGGIVVAVVAVVYMVKK